MGQQRSRDRLLYQYACSGNVEKIKALRAQGADLEWIDEVGRTPLIWACLHSNKYNVAKTLIELGANVNVYCPGSNAGTPLHHAAEKGLERTVKLLLSHGANALVMNDDSQTPLDIARVKQHSKVVRAIESHICLFSGWLREPCGPVILTVLAPQLLSRKVWVTVLPCASSNLDMPLKLELAIYSRLQDSQPRNLVALWNVSMEGVKFIQSDHDTVIISDIHNKKRIKLAPANENDKRQLHRFWNACKGIPQNKLLDGGASSSCVICLDAPVEGACIPCGHMGGCMSCLNEIKGKKWGCPMCRAKIDQVIRIYAV